MSHLLGVTDRSVERNIEKLQKLDYLRRVGSRKDGFGEVVYEKSH